jgi:hypothetical protein
MKDETAPVKLTTREYDAAFKRFFSRVLHGFRALDPILGEIPVGATIHRGPIRNVRGNSPLDHKMQQISGTTSIMGGVIRNSDLDAYISSLYEMSSSALESMTQMLFENLSQITEVTENVVDGGGKPISWDLILDALDKLKINFDCEGNPDLPMMVLSPQLLKNLSELDPTEDQLRRKEAILKRKKEEHDASQRRRRLS